MLAHIRYLQVNSTTIEIPDDIAQETQGLKLTNNIIKELKQIIELELGDTGVESPIIEIKIGTTFLQF